MRLASVFFLILAALALWFILFESIPSLLPETKYEYISFDASQFFTIWLFVLFATAAAYVATKRER